MATVQALTGFAALGRVVPPNTELDASDPLVVAFPQWFSDPYGDPAPVVVEEATAEPGAVRTTPAKKKAPAKRKATSVSPSKTSGS